MVKCHPRSSTKPVYMMKHLFDRRWWSYWLYWKMGSLCFPRVKWMWDWYRIAAKVRKEDMNMRQKVGAGCSVNDPGGMKSPPVAQDVTNTKQHLPTSVCCKAPMGEPCLCMEKYGYIRDECKTSNSETTS